MFQRNINSPLFSVLHNLIWTRSSSLKVVVPTRNKTKYQRHRWIMASPSRRLFVWQDFNEQPDLSDRFLQIALDFPTSNSKQNRIYLKRSYSDQFSGTKKRLEAKLEKLLPKNGAAKLTIEAFSQDGARIPDQTTNFDLFFGKEPCESIDIAGTSFSIQRDAVWLDKVDLALEPLVGCPILPSCDWKNVGEGIQYHWFTNKQKEPTNLKFENSKNCRVQIEGWDYVGSGLYYCPTTSDVDKYLAVVVDLGEHGMADVTVCNTPVKRPIAGWEEFIFENRQTQYCQKLLEGSKYRLVSYNVLAHLYLNDWLKKKSQEEQYFPYCPIEYQTDKHRYPVLLREIAGYNADLLFIQEVDFRFQKRFLMPFLSSKGYTPIFNCKENQVNEGLVIAFRTDRFKLGHNFSVKLSKLLELPSNSDINNYLDKNSAVSTILSSRPSILQLVHLCTKDGLSLLCANTHLHFDPAHEEVKILQSLLCSRHIRSILAKLGPHSPQVLFAGDFNSQPGSRAIRMLQGQQISLHDANSHFSQSQGLPFFELVKSFILRQMFSEPETEKMTIKEPIPFQSVAGFPDYTNYTQADTSKFGSGFIGCLDYLWAHPPVQVDRVIPMPEHEFVTKYGAIPSKICPSDHLPLICEVELPSTHSRL